MKNITLIEESETDEEIGRRLHLNHDGLEVQVQVESHGNDAYIDLTVLEVEQLIEGLKEIIK